MAVFLDSAGMPLCKLVGGHLKPIKAMYPSHSDTYIEGPGGLPFSLDTPMAWNETQGGWYAENAGRLGTALLTVNTSVFPFIWRLSMACTYPEAYSAAMDRTEGDYARYGCISGTGYYENVGNLMLA